MSDTSVPAGSQEALALLAQWSSFFDDECSKEDHDELVQTILEDCDEDDLVNVINCLAATSVTTTHMVLDDRGLAHREYFQFQALSNSAKD